MNAAIDEELTGIKLFVATNGSAAEPPLQTEEQAAVPVELSAAETAAVASLLQLRKAVEDYKTKEGKYPKRLSNLLPDYIPEIPEISLADHPATREVIEIASSDYDEALFQAIMDSGKWLYFTDKKSKYYGLVLLDCSHKNARGVEMYQAGEKTE